MESNTHQRFKQLLSTCIRQKNEAFLELFQDTFHLSEKSMYSTTEPILFGRFRADVQCKTKGLNLFFEIKVTNPTVPKEKRIYCENTNAGLIEVDLSDCNEIMK